MVYGVLLTDLCDISVIADYLVRSDCLLRERCSLDELKPKVLSTGNPLAARDFYVYLYRVG